MIHALLITAAIGGGICSSNVCVAPQRVITHSAPVVKQQIVKQHVAHVAHDYVAPVQTVYYAVGAHVQLDALIQQRLEDDPSYQAYKEWMAERTREYIQSQRQPPAAPKRLPRPRVDRSAPQAAVITITQACASCHGSATPDGGFFIDGQSGMDPASVLDAIQAIASGAMPKDRELSREQRNQLVGELFGLREDLSE